MEKLFYPYGASDIIPGGSGSDVGHLKELGTPLAGFTPDSQRYFDIHHAATDVLKMLAEGNCFRSSKHGSTYMAG